MQTVTVTEQDLLALGRKLRKVPVRGMDCVAQMTGLDSGIITLDFDGDAGNALYRSFGLLAHRRTPNGYHVDFEYAALPVLLGLAGLEGLDVLGNGRCATVLGTKNGVPYVWLRDPAPYSADALPQPQQPAPEFQPFPKIARLTRECVITEKIDGTNAQVLITEDGQVMAGSRTRWLQPGKNTDNFGFAAWVEANREELLKLGPGRHFGEWWGSGIQRTYGLKNGERHFSLFNVGKWYDPDGNGGTVNYVPGAAPCPACCTVVPVLYCGPFDTDTIDAVLAKLEDGGSLAMPGFMDPEGIIIFHTASGQLFKKTIKGDEVPKTMKRAA